MYRAVIFHFLSRSLWRFFLARLKSKKIYFGFLFTPEQKSKSTYFGIIYTPVQKPFPALDKSKLPGPRPAGTIASLLLFLSPPFDQS